MGWRRCARTGHPRARRRAVAPVAGRVRPAGGGCRRRPTRSASLPTRGGRGRSSRPGVSGGAVEGAPRLRQVGPRVLAPFALALDETPRRKCGAGTGATLEELAEPSLGDDRVLVRAEDVLKPLRAGNDLSCRLADLGLGQLGGVARSLAEDPDAVQLVIGRTGAELVGDLPEALELSPRQGREGDLAA